MSKADVLLKKASSFERLALYSDRKVFLQAIAQDVQQFPPVSNKGINAPYMEGTEPPVNQSVSAPTVTHEQAPDLQMPLEHITGYKPINKEQQSALFRTVTQDGLGFFDPNDADGKLGPQTRKALDLYKQKYFANKPNATDAEVLHAASLKASYGK